MFIHDNRPFDVGFEALGQIVAVGADIPKERIGSFIIYTQYGAFSEYCPVVLKAAIPVPVRRVPPKKKKNKNNKRH